LDLPAGQLEQAMPVAANWPGRQSVQEAEVAPAPAATDLPAKQG